MQKKEENVLQTKGTSAGPKHVCLENLHGLGMTRERMHCGGKILY